MNSNDFFHDLIHTRDLCCMQAIPQFRAGRPAQETGRGQDLSKGHQRYVFKVKVPYTNLFHDNDLLKGT